MTGSVTVTTASGTLTSNHEFRVYPVILTGAPTSGAAGTPVVITGSSFTQTTNVTFRGGKAAANFTGDSDTQVAAIVPAPEYERDTWSSPRLAADLGAPTPTH